MQLAFTQDKQDQEIVLLWAQDQHTLCRATYDLLPKHLLSSNPGGSELDDWKIFNENLLIAGISHFELLWEFWLWVVSIYVTTVYIAEYPKKYMLCFCM